MTAGSGHWHLQAALWQRIASPLRPSEEDLQQNVRWTVPILRRMEGSRAIAILGVTPELALMPWPGDVRILGIDRSVAMVRDVWPRAVLGARGTALNGDWRQLPLATGSLAWVIGDGSLSNLDSAADYDRLLAEVARTLRPEGRFSVRLYLGPDEPERPTAVIDALLDGGIGNFHAFKLRLAMALCAPDTHDIRVGDIFAFWSARRLDYADLERRTGLPRAVIETIDNYRESDIRYNFPPAGYVEERLARHFRIEDRFVPYYALGERCPSLLLAPR